MCQIVKMFPNTDLPIPEIQRKWEIIRVNKNSYNLKQNTNKSPYTIPNHPPISDNRKDNTLKLIPFQMPTIARKTKSYEVEFWVSVHNILIIATYNKSRWKHWVGNLNARLL